MITLFTEIVQIDLRNGKQYKMFLFLEVLSYNRSVSKWYHFREFLLYYISTAQCMLFINSYIDMLCNQIYSIVLLIPFPQCRTISFVVTMIQI